ncbi:MAG: glycosyltransferase family 4 protein [Acidimicrobiales bacterium]
MTNDEVMIAGLGLLAFAAVVVLIPLVLRVAVAYGVTDAPGQGKLHSATTPYLGGIAVVVAVLGASPLLPKWSAQAAVLLLAACAVGIAGLVDDMRTLRPTRRLAVEIGAAGLAFGAGARVNASVEPVDFVLTVIVLVVLTNSFNLLDNMDGALGVIGTTTALFLVGAAVLEGQVLVGGLGALVAGACLGFLVYNWHPAKIFLGDAGSLFLGFLLAAIALKLRFVVAPPESVAAVGLLLGPALFDTTLVVLSRARAGRPVYVGGTDHCSHRLLMLGLGTRTVAAVLAAGTAACGALGLAAARDVLPAAPLLAGATVVGVAALVALLRVPVYERGAGRDVDLRATAPVAIPLTID